MSQLTAEDVPVTIVTHSGGFHADDVLGVAIISELHDRAKVHRTRDESFLTTITGRLWPGLVYFVDVGGKSDGMYHFDHHQHAHPSDAGVRHRANGRKGSPYASAGLVWTALGPRVIAKTLSVPVDHEFVLKVAEDIDRRLIEAIDAHDVGQLYLKGCLQSDTTYMTTVHVTGFSQVIGLLNPTNLDLSMPSEFDYMLAFEHAVTFARRLLRSTILRTWQEYQSDIELDQIYKPETTPEILVLPRYMKWNRFVGTHPQIKFIVYPSKDGFQVSVADGGTSANGRQLRAQFPREWAGKRGAELEAISGVEGAAFCHNGRHLVGTKDGQSAMALIYATLYPKRSIEAPVDSSEPA